jgi:hypothetical protein
MLEPGELVLSPNVACVALVAGNMVCLFSKTVRSESATLARGIYSKKTFQKALFLLNF